jgi:hypothetical protein
MTVSGDERIREGRGVEREGQTSERGKKEEKKRKRTDLTML